MSLPGATRALGSSVIDGLFLVPEPGWPVGRFAKACLAARAHEAKAQNQPGWRSVGRAYGDTPRLRRPYQLDEFLHFGLEAIAVARERLRGGENLRGSRTGGCCPAVHVDNVGRDLARAG